MKIKYFIGFLLVLLGLGTMLENFGLFELSDIMSFWWPGVVIAVGIYIMTRARQSFFTGLFILLIGIIILANRMGMHIEFWGVFWALVLIFVGGWLLTSKFIYKHPKVNMENLIGYTSIFTGRDDRVVSDNFKGGAITAIFGGQELDLRQAEIPNSGEAILDVSAIFGGVEIIIPKDWVVISSGLPVFGGFTDKTDHSNESGHHSPKLKINYLAIFGGIEVLNEKKVK